MSGTENFDNKQTADQKSLKREATLPPFSGSDIKLVDQSGLGVLGLVQVGIATVGSLSAIFAGVAGAHGLAFTAGIAAFATTLNLLKTGLFYQDPKKSAVLQNRFTGAVRNITKSGISARGTWPVWKVRKRDISTVTMKMGSTIEGLITHDKLELKSLSYEILYRVVNAATYAFADKTHDDQIKKLVENSLRAEIGKGIAIKDEMLADPAVSPDVFSLRRDVQQVATKIISHLNPILLEKYGVVIDNIPIEYKLDQDFVDNMQRALIEEFKLEAQGRGQLKQRKVVWDGITDYAREQVHAGIFPTMKEAHESYMRLIELDAQQNTKGVVILDGSKRGDMGSRVASSMAALQADRQQRDEMDASSSPVPKPLQNPAPGAAPT
jgi:hypothetical protein